MQRIIVCIFLSVSAFQLLFSAEQDSLFNAINQFSIRGKHDSVIILSRPELAKALDSQDTLKAIYIGTLMAQSSIFLSDLDSVMFYLERIQPMLVSFPTPPKIKAMYFCTYGNYCLRTSLDYSKAINYYIKALEYTIESGNTNNQISVLSNIVNIFYVQNNRNGMHYAEEAYQLSVAEPQISNYAKASANIVMAQMLFVHNKYDEAMQYLNKAKTYAEEGKLFSQYAHIYSLMAQIYRNRSDYINAGNFYEKAIGYISYTDPGDVSRLYLSYGDFASDIGEYHKAFRLYKEGLTVSSQSGNIEYRQALLGKMADISFFMKDYIDAARYYKDYKFYSETISNQRKYEFDELISSKQKIESEKKTLAQELEYQKKLKRYQILILIFTVATGLSSLLFVFYRRQRKLYKELVQRHQDYLARCQPPSDNEASDIDRELFNRIENLMRKEEIYKSKTLSLEILAERLGTNRTYCSKAINTFAGMTFNRYVDTFRIEEATRVIASSGKELLIKQLADELGYNSVNVFSKAFQREIGCSPSIYRKEVLASKSRTKLDTL